MYREVNEMNKCASCGILVPCHEVIREHHGVKLVFCSDKCFGIYETYKFPKYKEKILMAERATSPPSE